MTDAEQDRHFRSLGYSMKMHDGEKLWCRHEEVLGSSVQRSSRTGCMKPCS